MGIYDVGYGGFGSFQSNYRISDIPKAPAAEIKPVEKVDVTPKANEISVSEIDNRPKSIDPNNVSLSFNKGNDFSYIGSDKDVAGLDMQKAISDMKQDSILQEYNYFVGNSNNVFRSDDGVVLAK